MVNELISINKNVVKNLIEFTEHSFDKRYVCNRKGEVFLIKEELDKSIKCVKMSPFETSDGYLEYVLTDKAGAKKHLQPQRIVADLYIDRPSDKNKKYVNHKDGNKKNNNVGNLEYVTHQENIQHTYDKLGRKGWSK